ncbi:phosphate starvation-inducible protein PhoH [Aerococcus urinaehominis]|uniref:PhoH-like protein n=1 Tax=Aerococcus urinaehominis TaxID=128944 RepID=A0A0X8FJJ4_9LACT|nr:PhoH family protein [Aerococcus urinaehominis]AMB98521.1 phosphate starvation-inducible protein PhoH [Aerococcus urinaehominis]SDL79664.1 phosphate starvation-inducible protein PhoH [Aerococcus urinaehominis]
MTDKQIAKEIYLQDPANAIQIYGPHDKNLSLIEDHFEVAVNSRGDKIEIVGPSDQVQLVIELIYQLEELLGRNIRLTDRDLMTAIKMAANGTLEHFIDLYDQAIGKNYEGKAIRAKSFGQKQYVDAINHNAITFGIGPAGTGKTFLAVVLAVQALKQGRVQRIILTRPAVEAGESLGFLPGDLKEKVDPYLRPIYDALYSVAGKEYTERLIEREVIEIAPLAYMRGRTLEDAFVILDEAQNTTPAQMKMFLTRLGFGSRMVVNGDATQIDLPRGVKSGLLDAKEKLAGLKDMRFIYFDAEDVVRHPVVAAIIKAYADEDPAVK